MINELRRIGGLLKHSFTTLYEADVTQERFAMQEHALQELMKAVNKIKVDKDR